MREIEFRGKVMIDCGDYKKDEWVYGYPVSNGDVWYILNYIVESAEDHFQQEVWFLVDPETVGKFTGLEDKNGVKIFEGDIVKCQASIITPSVSKVKGAVEDSLILDYPDGEKYSGPFSWQFSAPDIAEVIGNIYDNPELWEKAVKDE